MRLMLATCLGLSLVGPSHLCGQVLDDWYILHSSGAFDYLVTERGFGERDSSEQGPRVLRVTASRMLVRYVDETRLAIVQDRTARGMNSRGYDSFASSTYLLDVTSCDGQALVSVVEITDYDSRGQVLSRTRPGPHWAAAVAQWDDAATGRFIDWACSKHAGSTNGGSRSATEWRCRLQSHTDRVPRSPMQETASGTGSADFRTATLRRRVDRIVRPDWVREAARGGGVWVRLAASVSESSARGPTTISDLST